MVDIDYLKQLYLTKSSKEIENITCMKYSSVYYIVKKNFPDLIKPPLKIKQEVIDIALNMYREGRSITHIGNTLNVNAASVYNWIKSNGIETNPRNRKFYLDETYFDTIDTQEKAYILGFLYADGYNNEKNYTLQVTLQKRDIEIINFIKKELSTNSPVKEYANNYVSINIHSKKISKSLHNQGCTQAKTFTLKFPDFLEKQLYRHFIRGYFDGDGCVYNPKNRNTSLISFLGNTEFILALHTKLHSDLGFKDTHISSTRSLNIKLLRYNRQKQVALLKEYMYQDASFFLERKYLKFKI